MEMTPESDADIMIAAPDGLDPEAAAHEARALSADFAFAAQAGLPFGIDLRLRPEGRQGPLAVRRPALEAYAAARMEPWERLAWVRADLAAGPAGPLAWLRKTAVADGLSRKDAESLARMKERIESERSRGPLDLRLGPGGLDDIQWCLGVLILQSDPGLDACDSQPLLEALADQGRLSADEACVISRAQAAWIAARHRLALLGQEGGLLPPDSARMEEVAQVPFKELKELQAGVRASFERVMREAMQA
jgi:glutamate-ammonia-ligase adenylyltransferase